MLKFFKKRAPGKALELGFQIRQVIQPADGKLPESYALADRFFDEHIADPTRSKLAHVQAKHGRHNTLLMAYKGEELVGAIWAGTPVAEAIQAETFDAGYVHAPAMKELANAMLDHTWMLFDLAVVPECRGQGLALELMRLVLAEAKEHGTEFLWGVSSAESVGFYERVGIRVSPSGSTLVISHNPPPEVSRKRTDYGLPITGESRWIVAQIRNKNHLNFSHIAGKRQG
ncbi:GNAT family N-acetyltransferase [Glutamicibacter ardleyensis]|uniref:GNAT family N-acetyltransferase n=1 Tax=Glutamicibacter ardleyensis TaxID=225894 RepID=UPI003FD5E642